MWAGRLPLRANETDALAVATPISENVGHGVAITANRGQMIAKMFLTAPIEVPLVKSCRQAEVRHRGCFKRRLLPRHSASPPRPHEVQTSIPTDCGSRPAASIMRRNSLNLANAAWWRGIVLDPAISPFGNSRHRPVVMSAIPHRRMPRCRARIDTRVVDRVVHAFERDMLVFPERAHHSHLLLGSASTVVEILLQTDEFDLVPADTDAQSEPPFGQDVEACRLFSRSAQVWRSGHDQHAGRQR